MLSANICLQAPAAPNSTYIILSLLSEIYDELLDSWAPISLNEEENNRIRALENRIGSLPIMAVSFNYGADDAVAIQVYQMAARIYCLRASQSSWELSTAVETLTDNVFAGPLPGHACGHFFPLLILVCETRTDERRRTILELIDKTEKNAQIKGIKGLRNTVKSIWVQQDLQADSDLLVNYLGMMSAMNSSSNAPSSFAWVS